MYRNEFQVQKYLPDALRQWEDGWEARMAAKLHNQSYLCTFSRIIEHVKRSWMKYCVKNQDDLNVMCHKWCCCKKLMYAESIMQTFF